MTSNDMMAAAESASMKDPHDRPILGRENLGAFALLMIGAALYMFDGIMTIVAMDAIPHAREANPLVATLISAFGGVSFYVLKLLIIATVAAGFLWLRRHGQRRMSWVAASFLIIIGGAGVASALIVGWPPLA